MEFTVIRLNAFENCLSLSMSCYSLTLILPLTILSFSTSHTELRKRKSSNLNSTIMQKLELCPKIKLNKSLHSSLSRIFSSLYHHRRRSSCFIYNSKQLWQAKSREKYKKNIFTIFHIDDVVLDFFNVFC
jgi:hypothetical protein